MPKYFEHKVYGYYLYFTSKCIVEAMHAHASDKKLTRAGSAKLFVKSNGDTIVKRQGTVSDIDILRIQGFIKENYLTMFEKWKEYSKNGFFEDGGSPKR